VLNRFIVPTLNRIPHFFLTFCKILLQPKEWSLNVTRDNEASFSDALIFFGISIILTEVLRLPMIRRGTDLFTYTLLDVCWKFIVLTGFWLLLAGSLSIFVKQPAHIKNAILSLYYFGVLNVLVHAVEVISWSIYHPLPKCEQQDFWCRLTTYRPLPQIPNDLLELAFLVPILLWCVLSWRTYAIANGISIARLVVVTVVAAFLGIPFAEVGLLLRVAVLDAAF
jgi:hypothetical protein